MNKKFFLISVLLINGSLFAAQKNVLPLHSGDLSQKSLCTKTTITSVVVSAASVVAYLYMSRFSVLEGTNG